MSVTYACLGAVRRSSHTSSYDEQYIEAYIRADIISLLTVDQNAQKDVAGGKVLQSDIL